MERELKEKRLKSLAEAASAAEVKDSLLAERRQLKIFGLVYVANNCILCNICSVCVSCY